MVKLDRIYTRGGDAGETSLGDGSRVKKHAPRIVAQGDVDEAGAAIGLARAALDGGKLEAALARVQNDLFDLGADLTRPGDDGADGALRIGQGHLRWLEGEIDRINAGLAPLRSFVLRGGRETAARLHLACTVVRRAERSLARLAEQETVNPLALAYLNRLSDLLFVMARTENDGGRADVLWRPGASAEG